MIRDYLTYAAIVGVLAYAASLLAWWAPIVVVAVGLVVAVVEAWMEVMS